MVFADRSGIRDEVQTCRRTSNETNRTNRLVRDIENYLQCEYHRRELTVVDVAREFNLSPSYFPHFFKEQTGNSFRIYLERLRVHNAGHMLEQRNGDTMEAIAEAVGYCSVRSFRRAFKRTKGVPPAHYVRSV
jgi:YesN/AraC family two-component response regulator